MALKFDIKKTGIPVVIGDVKLTFDNSIENLNKILKAYGEIDKKINRLQRKYKGINLPDEINEETLKNVKPEETDKVIDFYKEFIGMQYDLIFGQGTFNTLYQAYPNITALQEVLEEVSAAVAKEIEANI